MQITIDTTRYEQIERERNETYGDAGFQTWMQELKVSRLWSNPEPRWNARDAMQEWDSSRFDTNVIKV
jgi:hypothetical protein